MNRRLFLFAGLALAGCATAPRTLTPAIAPFLELEPVYRAEAGREGLTISVSSGGCTAKADFAVYLERKGGALSLAFARKRLDRCKSFAIGRTDLSFSWAELGVPRGTPVFLLNPLTGWIGPGSAGPLDNHP